ncbi:hypothetical protein ACFSYD_01365 [Paracoccus aerius]
MTRWDVADSARRGFPGIPWGYDPFCPRSSARPWPPIFHSWPGWTGRNWRG